MKWLNQHKETSIFVPEMGIKCEMLNTNEITNKHQKLAQLESSTQHHHNLTKNNIQETKYT